MTVSFEEHGENFYVSSVQNNSEFDYFIAIDITEVQEDTFIASLQIVAPSSLPEACLCTVSQCCGVPFDEFKDLAPRDQVSDICSYGYSASITSCQGSSPESLFADLKKEAQIIPTLIGFYLDKSQGYNRTGWQAIKGE